MTPTKPARHLTLENFAQIRRASVDFGDLTLLIGPQATGKSLFLQWAKLAFDVADILHDFEQYGLQWHSDREFCDLYFGDGYHTALRAATRITVGRTAKTLSSLLEPRGRVGKGKLYYVPAHRSLLMADGWPRPFQQYFSDTPYVARSYSERLRTLLSTSVSSRNVAAFSARRPFRRGVRKEIDQAVFHGAVMNSQIERGRQRLVLSPNARTDIPFMAWTAGQREFSPLLLSANELMPAKTLRKLPVEHVVLEEPEMGLHPKAIMVCVMLIVDLLHRGYRVTVSTHSPLLTTVAWALRQLQKAGATGRDYRALLGMPSDCAAQAESLAHKSIRAYYFDYEGEQVFTRDISELDPGSHVMEEAGWGGLSGVAGSLGRGVASVVNAHRAASRAKS